MVRDGHLAPYQELAWFTAPLQSEHDWLAERHLRFAELLDHLHSSVPREEEHLAFAPWVIGPIRHADDGTEQARLPRQPANRLALRELRDDHVPQPER